MPSGEVKINIWGDPWEVTKRKNCQMRAMYIARSRRFHTRVCVIFCSQIGSPVVLLECECVKSRTSQCEQHYLTQLLSKMTMHF